MRSSTRVSVAEAAGVGFHRPPTMEHIARELYDKRECSHPSCADFTDEEQQKIALAAKEMFLRY